MRPGFEELLRSGLLGARSFDGRLGLELNGICGRIPLQGYDRIKWAAWYGAGQPVAASSLNGAGNLRQDWRSARPRC
ncbi:unnamed protein product [Prunus armeniaca]|uniref:Uncharacterized protein n=1 Tax=Prunus armeniaca TaxID=36596 RepID=A0A6J5VQ92_PRUAR|nr:unnamed protein product [Prunus armeniaca]